MDVAIMICALVIAVCIVTNRFTSRFGIPTVLIFMMIGMLFGSEGLFKIPFEDFERAEQICSIALVFIMFYGGFGTSFKQARLVIGKAVTLATAGVVLTAVFTGMFCTFVMGMDAQEGLLMGSVIASTDAASVFSILRSKSLNLKDGTASLLEVESGSNDPFSYMMTVLVLGWMGGTQTPVLEMLVKQLGFGILFGVGLGALAVLIFTKVEFAGDSMDRVLMISMVLFSYAAPLYLGGNGYLSAYLLGIIIGNQRFKNKVQLVHFFDGINQLAQILIFFLLGLLVTPSSLVPIFWKAVLIFVGLTFIARPLTTAILLTPQKSSWRQQVLISVAGLRGAASIVFAIMVTVSPNYVKNDVYNVVFCIALISSSLQGIILPLAAKKLDMVDEKQNVMKTFSDYQDDNQLNFIQIVLKPGNPHIGKTIAEVNFGNLLVILIERGKETILPRGNIQLEEGDVLVLSGESYQGDKTAALEERYISEGDEWIGKKVCELSQFDGSLIVLIRREEGTAIVPKGETQIKLGDTLVLSTLGMEKTA
jgi:cell volume regulation protein A